VKDVFAICYWLTAVVVVAPHHVRANDDVDFGSDVRPILSDVCFQCHGPDANARQSELRLDTHEGLFGDRGGYAAFVPNSTDRSEAIRRITADDLELQMPPPDAEVRLTKQQAEMLRRWVEQGAPWEGHWSFEPVSRPQLPIVSNDKWCRNGIDRFVMARLDREGVTVSGEAAKATLIRRVTLDLTGLPPTPADVDNFLADDSPRAYEKLVDRLLASSRYGERMALMWLDAARYADTDGYQNDGPRYMWRWRDWVIEAYNANVPFDQFTVEQLAGDLLPNATLEQRIATGFNRNHRYNSESGLVLEEFLLENAVDRVDTTSTVWMGLTMGCARCHDHKYDPFSQQEYYRLIAYFDKVTESGRAVKFGNSEPWVVAPTRDQQARLGELDAEVDAAVEALAKATSGMDATIDTRRFEPTVDDGGEVPSKLAVTRGLKHHFAFDEDDPRIEPQKGDPRLATGVVGTAATLDGDSQFVLGSVGDVQCHKRSSIAFWLRPEDLGEGVILSRQITGSYRSGLAVELRDGCLQFFIITRWVAGVGALETRDRLPQGEWVHVCLTNDGSQSVRGMRIYLNGTRADTRTLYNTNSNTGGTQKGSKLRVGGGVHGPHFTGQVDELRIYNRTLWEDEIELLAVADPVPGLLAVDSADRTKRQRAVLRNWFLEQAAPTELAQLAGDYFQARSDRQKFWDSLPTTMVMEEGSSPEPTRLRVRGVYNDYGAELAPGVPQAFPSLPGESTEDRLGLTRWLVDGRHPLTARVAVNRYWQKYFGIGLVKTSEDFGVQGQPPSHPDLLDWLADEFVQSGWDVKAMQRLIVTSSAYRQTSRVSSELARRDPQNRLLARGPRSRLPAHTIRDQALFVSGLLVERPGGPSVSPYQPTDLWKEMSNMVYEQSAGDDLYRRSLYTIWKRTVAPPSMAILDAADRENCQVTTTRTNTPLQALTLLNETAFVEAARKLGERMLVEAGDDPVKFAFRTVMCREPAQHELALLQQARQDYLVEFSEAPDEAAKLITIGESVPSECLDPIELAANTVLANVLLNLDETVSKE